LQGCERYVARCRSLAALEPIGVYVAQPSLADLKRVIAEDRSNRSLLDSWAAARPTLVPFQRFRARARHLSAAAIGILRLLRAQEKALDALPGDELEKV